MERSQWRDCKWRWRLSTIECDLNRARVGDRATDERRGGLARGPTRSRRGRRQHRRSLGELARSGDCHRLPLWLPHWSCLIRKVVVPDWTHPRASSRAGQEFFVLPQPVTPRARVADQRGLRSHHRRAASHAAGGGRADDDAMVAPSPDPLMTLGLPCFACWMAL